MVNDTALGRMQQWLLQWDSSGDARAIFLNCYAMMTGNMQTALQSSEFEDGPWVSKLVDHFAIYYFSALDAFEEGSQQTPPVWQVAFKAAALPRTHALQNLVLGVNAHINHDLVFAVADLLEGEWGDLAASARESRYRDFCLVNEIIRRTIDAVQDQVLEQWSPAMRLVDDLLGPLDEQLVVWKITDWRNEVWDQAVAFVEEDAAGRMLLSEQVEHTSLRRARAILGDEGLLGFLNAL